MSIQSLPEAASAALASAQVITDPVSVVRELVANALDASASSVSVQVALNAIDAIQVSDNGHGIAPDDRGIIGQRHRTSKIRSLEDLSNLGGRSLGFRGEALASILDMSEDVIISTRIESQLVGVNFSISQFLENRSEQPLSHSTGTTVRVVNFLARTPVRKQCVLKKPAKALEKIKRTLQAFTLARPGVRFSLKILKAEADPSNWVYPAKPSATLADAVSSCFGASAMAQCELQTWDPQGQSVRGREVADRDRFVLTALLPTKHCDVKLVDNLGQWVSVDSRPVSADKGALKRVVSAFKSLFKASSKTDNVSNPLLCLDISCPSVSYDVNVEPAKDDVLFTDDEVFTGLCEAFFGSYYAKWSDHSDGLAPTEETSSMLFVEQTLAPTPHQNTTTSPPALSPSSAHQALSSSQHTSFEIQASQAPRALLLAESDEQQDPDLDGRQASNGPVGQPSTYDGHGQSADENDAYADENENGDPDLPSPGTLNPWTIAQMNATLKPTRQLRRPVAQPIALSDPATSLPRRVNRVSLPSPATLSSPAREPDRRVGQHRQYLPTPAATSPLSKHGFGGTRRGSGRSTRPMDDWLQRAPRLCEVDADADPHLGTPLQAIPNASQSTRQLRRGETQSCLANRPFKMPGRRVGGGVHLGRSESADDLGHRSSGAEAAETGEPSADVGGDGARDDASDAHEAALAVDGPGLHPNLVLQSDVDLAELERRQASILPYDSYAAVGEPSDGFEKPDWRLWEAKLRSLPIADQLSGDIDVRSALRDHLAVFG